jgi:hypothetical protein
MLNPVFKNLAKASIIAAPSIAAFAGNSDLIFLGKK